MSHGDGNNIDTMHNDGSIPPMPPAGQPFVPPPPLPGMSQGTNPAFMMPPHLQQMAGMSPSMMQLPSIKIVDPPGKAAKGSYTRFKKAPDAPKRFKSAFIIFSSAKHKEIKEKYSAEGRTEKTTDIAKLVSQAWREMGAEERGVWEEKARKDKARYEMERTMYKGPWKVPANKRPPKDPNAPKRPMSAFLDFSNKRRAMLKRENPDATNADLSKMLSKQWKELDPEVKKEYVDREIELRNKYKATMMEWREKVAAEKKAERKEREALVMQAIQARQKGENVANPPQPAQDMSANYSMPYGYGMPPNSDFGGHQGAYSNPNFMPSPFANPQLFGSATAVQLQQMLAQQQQNYQQQGQLNQPNAFALNPGQYQVGTANYATAGGQSGEMGPPAEQQGDTNNDAAEADNPIKAENVST